MCHGAGGAAEASLMQFLIEILILLLIAGACGALAQAIAGWSRGGCLAAVALGFIGALLGTWLARWLNLPELFTISVGGTAFPVIWSIIGATVFAAVVAFLSRRRT